MLIIISHQSSSDVYQYEYENWELFLEINNFYEINKKEILWWTCGTLSPSNNQHMKKLH